MQCRETFYLPKLILSCFYTCSSAFLIVSRLKLLQELLCPCLICNRLSACCHPSCSSASCLNCNFVALRLPSSWFLHFFARSISLCCSLCNLSTACDSLSCSSASPINCDFLPCSCLQLHPCSSLSYFLHCFTRAISVGWLPCRRLRTHPLS